MNKDNMCTWVNEASSNPTIMSVFAFRFTLFPRWYHTRNLSNISSFYPCIFNAYVSTTHSLTKQNKQERRSFSQKLIHRNVHCLVLMTNHSTSGKAASLSPCHEIKPGKVVLKSSVLWSQDLRSFFGCLKAWLKSTNKSYIFILNFLNFWIYNCQLFPM